MSINLCVGVEVRSSVTPSGPSTFGFQGRVHDGAGAC